MLFLCDGGIDRRHATVVKSVHKDSMQGDLRFLEVLEKLGCHVTDTEAGIEVTGTNDGHYPGITVDMNDFSDQTMTLAALAPFADSPTTIRNIGHIRLQESGMVICDCQRINKNGDPGRRRRRFFSHLSGNTTAIIGQYL